MHGHRSRRSSTGPVWIRVGLVLLLTISLGAEARGQRADGRTRLDLPLFEVPTLESRDPGVDLADATPKRPSLTLDPSREAWLLGIAARLWLVTQLVTEEARVVPAGGFDPGAIRWSFDRGVVGNHDPRASRTSDRTREASLLLPGALLVLTARSGRRGRDLAVGGTVYAEALLLTKSLTHLGKVLLGRPRPGTYATGPDASDATSPEPVGSGAFHSLPSSHAATAWTGASLAVTTHLLLRPRARGLERFGLGFVGGALAGATSALRVSSGAHFPSDVIAGAGVGIASGVLIPLVHRDSRPPPGRRAILQSVGGLAMGTLAGVLLGG